METTFKTKFEYCHIFDDTLVISQTPEIGDLLEDYAKSVSNVFKTLMVFFVFIPIFTVLSIVFYNIELLAFSVYTGAFALFFLVMAFYTMLFTSGSPVIEKKSIYRIRIQKLLFNEVLVIIYKEAGRYKRRSLVLEKDYINEVTELLLSEKLIEDKDIDLKVGIMRTLPFTMLYVFFAPSFLFLKDKETMIVYYGTVITILILVVLIEMFKNSIPPFYYNRKRN